MNKKESRNIQRIYQRQGCVTWTSTVVYSGREREGLHYIVFVLDKHGKEHSLYEATERVGGTRVTTI
jgi:hypothetical protein